jgi:hypothetical protein
VKNAFGYLLPTLGAVLFCAVLAGSFAMGPRMLNIDGDLGRHITIGTYILDSGSIPTQDIFSHTMMGKDLTPHEWLAQVLFALAYRLMDLSGAVILSALCIAWALRLVFIQAWERSGSLMATLMVVVLGVAASSLHWLTRPHILTFLFLAVWLNGLHKLRQGGQGKLPAWIWMPLVMLLWANLHGAFITGFAVWALYGLAYLWERWVEGRSDAFRPGFGWVFLLVGALSALASLLNPDGVGLWQTSLGYLGNRYLVGHTAEYLSPDFHKPAFWPFLLLVCLGLGLFGISKKRQHTVDVLLFTAWTGMAMISARNIPLFVVAAVPVIAEVLHEVISGLRKTVRFFRALDNFDQRLSRVEAGGRGEAWPIAASLFLLVLGLSGVGYNSNRFNSHVFPVEAVHWLKSHPQEGEVFNYFPWGGYLLYRSWPDIRVFIDGQTDFYGESLTREYEQVLTVQPGWEGVLEKYHVGWMILPPAESIARAVEEERIWVEVYRDETAVIFRRKSGQP